MAGAYLSDLTPWPPSLRGKGEILARVRFSPPRFGEGPGERLTRHEWDPKRWPNPKPTRVDKWGPGGEAPMAGGRGGCPPTKPKEGASSPH